MRAEQVRERRAREKAERAERKAKKAAAAEEPAAADGTPSLRTIRNSASSWMERGRAAQEEELALQQAKLTRLESELEERGHSMSNAKKSEVSAPQICVLPALVPALLVGTRVCSRRPRRHADHRLPNSKTF